MTADGERLWCWVDVETTGLDERTGSILEVGLVLTRPDLTEVASWSRAVAFWGPVDDEIARMHGPTGSGLLTCSMLEGKWHTYADERCKAQSLVEEGAVAWLREHCGDVAPLWCGRNVAFDRRWLRHHMPVLHDAISHRSVDETSLRLAMEAWGGLAIPKDPAAGTRHRALDDLRQSIAVAQRMRDLLRERTVSRG